MIHLITTRSESTVCGVPRPAARGNVSLLRTEVDCPACRARRVPAAKAAPSGPFSARGLGIIR